jgi:hypothetical protein
VCYRPTRQLAYFIINHLRERWHHACRRGLLSNASHEEAQQRLGEIRMAFDVIDRDATTLRR